MDTFWIVVIVLVIVVGLGVWIHRRRRQLKNAAAWSPEYEREYARSQMWFGLGIFTVLFGAALYDGPPHDGGIGSGGGPYDGGGGHDSGGFDGGGGGGFDGGGGF